MLIMNELGEGSVALRLADAAPQTEANQATSPWHGVCFKGSREDACNNSNK
jgi:hypothetical protein